MKIMIKTKPTTSFSMMLRLALVMAVCAGSLWGCAATGNKETLWHQHYEPVEDAALMAVAHDTLAEAIRLMGEPTSPVRDIHIRQSVARIRPASLSRADIISWERLSRAMAAGLKHGGPTPGGMDENTIHGRNSFYPALSPGILQRAKDEKPPHENRFAIIRELNRFIASGPSPDQRRARLETLFPGAIRPMPPAIYKAEGFELCETIHASPGSFVVYVAPARHDPLFAFKLSHEIAHLINPYLYDWHIEGLCDHFAEHMAQIQGADPEAFEKWFLKNGERNPYAASYLMIRDVKKIAGADIWRLFQFAEPTPEDRRRSSNIYPNRMRVNIAAWLNSLAPEKRAPAEAAMRRWSGILKRSDSRNSVMISK